MLTRLHERSRIVTPYTAQDASQAGLVPIALLCQASWNPSPSFLLFYHPEICLYAPRPDGPMPSALVSSHHTHRGNCQDLAANQQPDPVYLLRDAQTASDDAVLLCRYTPSGFGVDQRHGLFGGIGRMETFEMANLQRKQRSP